MTLSWSWNEELQCWAAEQVVYCSRPVAPELQCMNIYVPKEYLDKSGAVQDNETVCGYTAKTAPIIFENCVGGYMEARPEPLAVKENGKALVAHGCIYVTAGARGRTTMGDGAYIGKAPAALVDLKAGIRWLRSLGDALPGDKEKLISLGGSAGGALSALVGVSGNHSGFEQALKEMGAAETGDQVYAAQCFCPISELETADGAYEWMFQADPCCHDPFDGEKAQTPFQQALSQKLASDYVRRWNQRELCHPETGEQLTLDTQGQGGSACRYLLGKLEDSATAYFTALERGEWNAEYTVEQQIAGDYQRIVHTPGGDHVEPGEDKRGCVSWDGQRAHISDFTKYVQQACPRMKGTPAFDGLRGDAPENQLFGTENIHSVHFDPHMAGVMEELQEQFPQETAEFLPAYVACAEDEALNQRVKQMEPLHYLEQPERCCQAEHFRISVGSRDAHTSFLVSLGFALKLAETGKDVDYAFFWDEGHGQPGTPQQLIEWVDRICMGGK